MHAAGLTGAKAAEITPKCPANGLVRRLHESITIADASRVHGVPIMRNALLTRGQNSYRKDRYTSHASPISRVVPARDLTQGAVLDIATVTLTTGETPASAYRGVT